MQSPGCPLCIEHASPPRSQPISKMDTGVTSVVGFLELAFVVPSISKPACFSAISANWKPLLMDDLCGRGFFDLGLQSFDGRLIIRLQDDAFVAALVKDPQHEVHSKLIRPCLPEPHRPMSCLNAHPSPANWATHALSLSLSPLVALAVPKVVNANHWK